MVGFHQVGAILKRNAIEKKRNSRVTFCECCSHLFIVLLLMYGFALSEVLYFDEETYSSIEVTIPPFQTSSSDTSQVASALDILNGPLPIPSFDAFVSVGRLVDASGDSSDEFLDLLASTSIGRRFNNLLQEGALHFAPEGPEVTSLIEYLNSTTLTFATMTYHTHSSEKAAIDYIQDNLEEYAFALIVLPDSDVISESNIQYKIRQNYTTLPNTNEVVNWISIGLDTEYQKYLLSGFLTLQMTIDAWAFEYSQDGEDASPLPATCSTPQYWTMPFPTAAYDQNIFFRAVGFLLGLAMIMATMYPVSKLIKAVVEEKESKMREVMKIMGLRNWAHQLSWSLTALVLFLWISLSTAYLCHVSFVPKSDFRLLFLFLFTFCLSEITFSFLIASFFSKAKLAAIVGPVCLFCSILPRYIFFGTNRYEEQQSKYLASLLSPSAFSFGADILADYEYAGVGVQMNNIDDGLYNFRGCVQIMFFDFLWYGLLAWYLDQVVPGDIGTPLHPLFLFHKSYWFPKSHESNALHENTDISELLRDQASHPDSPPASHMEPIAPSDLANIKVLISGLQKRYNDGKYGVKHLSVAMLQDQITCLLGHNGAGKTTTISVLTGLIRATGGESWIWGNSLSNDLQNIREITGICPQQNVLFPFLTVEEHLYFFCRLKGVPEGDIPAMAEVNMTDVGLLGKRHVATRALSGGMKRKTCLAIALSGNPKCVFLDEPTSGMDPYSRRSTWELLQKKKKGRVIILTTHFLEEAEILGDRIVIMSDGKLRCSGSSLFLKSQFGAGYILTITRDVDAMNRSKRSIAEDEDELLHLVQSHVPSAKISSSIGAELQLELPTDVSPQFPALFAMLKKYAEEPVTIIDGGGEISEFVVNQTGTIAAATTPKLRISSYGVQYVTLEQVFIRLAHAEQQRGHNSGSESVVAMAVTDEGGESGGNVILSKSTMVPTSTSLSLVPAGDDSEDITNKDYKALGDEDDYDGQIMKCIAGRDEEKEYVVLGDVDAVPEECTVVRDDDSDLDAGADSTPRKDSQVMPIDGKLDDFESDSAYSSGNLVLIQLFELFKKRLIIASRDKKGLFFLILIPAIQIALVLAVLTIEVNPAGRSLSMRADIYDETVTAVLSDNSTMWEPNDVREHLNSGRMDFSETNTTTSDEMSEHMLKTYTNPHGQRFGGYVYDDEISVNVTVEWLWVRDNMPFLLENFDLFGPFLDGLDINNFNFNFGNNSFIADLNITSTTPAVENALDAIFGNETYIVFNNFTIYRANITDFIDDNGDFSVDGGVDGDISFDSLKVVDGDIVLVDLEVTFNNDTFDVGNVTISAADFNSLLPNETISYTTAIPTEYSVLQNSTSPHAVGVFISELLSAAFIACTGDNTASYSLRNHPLPLTIEQAIEIQVILSVLASLFILIPLCYIPASFVIFIVKERTSKSKHLQLVSGISPYLYWVASYLWDTVMYLILAGFIMLTFILYGEEAARIFIGNPEAGWAVFMLLVLYGLASIPLSYIYSLAFDNHSTAQISIMTWNFFTGFVFVLAYYIMISIPSTQETAESLVHFFRIFPPYNIGEGLINISVNYFNIQVLEANTSYFAWIVTGRNLTYMVAQCVVYFSIILLTEVSLFRYVYTAVVKYIVILTTERNSGSSKLSQGEEDDEDIIAERQAVQSADPNDFILFIKNIKKTYSSLLPWNQKPKYAVRGIDLTCAAGERFGLLGINGAGKTTTLGMLTGDLQPTSGEAYISGLPLSDPNTRKFIGFCPQTDPLLELMTGWETLWFFGRVRGMPANDLRQRCDELVDQVGLTQHAYKPCGTYSGGNKRKLSLAVVSIVLVFILHQ